MQTKLTYEWMDQQINRLEKAVINQCDFCVGKNDKKRAFPMNNEFDEHVATAKAPSSYDEKRIDKIRLIEEYINHYEFLVLEEIMIIKKQHGDYKRWEELLDRLESSRKIIDKLTSTLQYTLDIKSHNSIDVLSKVSFIFLPLSFITGYFGMNFTTMGMVGKNMNPKGVLMWKNGHTFVKFLLLFILIAAIIILSYIEKYNMRDQAIQQTISSLVQAQSGASDDLS